MISVRLPRSSVPEASFTRNFFRFSIQLFGGSVIQMEGRICLTSLSPCIRQSKDRQLRLSHLVEVEIADGLAGWGVLGFLHGLFEFLCQDVFLVCFLHPGITEFVFALPVLLGKNLLSVSQVNIRSGFHRRFMREHGSEDSVHHQLRLAARARHVQIFAAAISHEAILRRPHEKRRAQHCCALLANATRVVQALAGFSPRVKPGAGRSSGRTTLGSVLGAACVGGGGGGSFSGSGLPSMSSFTSLASMTSRSSSACAMRSRVSRLLDRSFFAAS